MLISSMFVRRSNPSNGDLLCRFDTIREEHKLMTCPTLQQLPPPPPGKTGWPWTEASPALPPTNAGKPWPTISVVTPSYNQARFLEETIRSVLLQGYPALEYIVMDGGSQDGSAEIIRKYAPWLSYWQSERDGGQSAAIAAGFARASGEIIAWLNSDDRYRPGTLARAAWFMARHPRAVFAGGDTFYVDVDGMMQKRIFAVPPNRFLTAHLGRHSLAQPSCFWRRRAYEQIGGLDHSLRFCMDRDLFIRLFAVGPSLRIPGPPLSDFRVHEESKTSTLVDIHEQEGAMLIAKYGTSPLRRSPWLLDQMWRMWYRSTTSVRRRIQGSLGWEY
jgi:glycosyltransferase involved in cell wall biosynthesis